MNERTFNPLEGRARGAWVEYLALEAHWFWFVALTFSSNVSEETARGALKWWVRKVAQDCAKAHFKFAYVIGRQACGRWHFHVLVSWPQGKVPYPPEWAPHLWNQAPPRFHAGGAHSSWYDPMKAGVAYSVFRHDETDINVACPRTGKCAHRRCLLGPPL